MLSHFDFALGFAVNLFPFLRAPRGHFKHGDPVSVARARARKRRREERQQDRLDNLDAENPNTRAHNVRVVVLARHTCTVP